MAVKKLAKKEKNWDVYDYLVERASEQKERELNKRNEKLVIGLTKDNVFLEEFERIVTKTFKNKFPKVKAKKKSKVKVKRILNLLWSDLHFGANTDPREVRHAYGNLEASRRMASIVKQVGEYKRQYRGETELAINIIGDIIQGQLHDMRDGAPLAEQCALAMHILVQAISYLSQEFPNGVTVRYSSGNHGRNTARHKERATLQKFDSIESILAYGIKLAFRNDKNVKMEIPYSPYYSYDVFDKRIFCTHGDTVLTKVGFPGSNINVGGIKNQINSINAAEGKKGAKYDVFAMGHVHVASQTYLPGDSILITNGALIPPDTYAESIGLFDCSTGQWLWESVPGFAVGDSRFCRVTEADDKNAELDTIITPFKGL